MSNALAIAGVTAVLKDLLNDGMINHDVSATLGATVKVSAGPPDRVLSSGDGQENPQLNIFLYQVTPNTGWSNAYLPSRNSAGDRTANQPLALDLHYLLSAYSAKDLQGEILLGYAMQLLHESPVLSREGIRETLKLNVAADLASLPPELRALKDCGLADQVEQIKITPEYLNTEEMSKLWTAVQSNYRPTAAYLATVVLIEAEEPTRYPLPVLTRGPNDEGVLVQPHLVPPVPTITGIEYPQQQLSARSGETITISGHHLDGNNIGIVFSNKRLPAAIEVAPDAGATPTKISVTLPNAPANWVAGIYTLAVLVERPGELFRRTTNEVPLLIAPTITNAPLAATRNSGVVKATVNCNPEVRPGQTAALIIGEYEAVAQPISAQTNSLDFEFPDIAAGDYPVRLRVDGIESWLIDKSATPPVFVATQEISVPV